MSITREQLKVGETYIDGNDTKRMVIFVGESVIVYSWVDAMGVKSESSSSDSHFLDNVSIIKSEPKKLGEVAWFMSVYDGEIYTTCVGDNAFKEYSESTSYQRVTLKDNEIWGFYE